MEGESEERASGGGGIEEGTVRERDRRRYSQREGEGSLRTQAQHMYRQQTRPISARVSLALVLADARAAAFLTRAVMRIASTPRAVSPLTCTQHRPRKARGAVRVLGCLVRQPRARRRVTWVAARARTARSLRTVGTACRDEFRLGVSAVCDA
jgi:hypothetical protein